MESPPELGDLAANCGEVSSPYKFDNTGGVRVVDRTYQTPSEVGWSMSTLLLLFALDS